MARCLLSLCIKVSPQPYKGERGIKRAFRMYRHSVLETFNQTYYLISNKIKRMKQTRHWLKGKEPVRLYALLKMFEYVLFPTIWITILANFINYCVPNMILPWSVQMLNAYSVFVQYFMWRVLVNKVIGKESQVHRSSSLIQG